MIFSRKNEDRNFYSESFIFYVRLSIGYQLELKDLVFGINPIHAVM